MELFDFIEKSPNPYFAVRNMAEIFTEAGYTALSEKDKWKLSPGKYFVTRDGSSFIAFSIPTSDFRGFNIIASHSDSPAFKIKSNPQMTVENAYKKLNTEKYGGMIASTWFDRPLSVAGRVMVESETGVECRLVNIDRDLVFIPSLAIHMDRTSNEGHKYEFQKELLPLYSSVGSEEDKKDDLMAVVAEAAGTEADKILDSDLFLYNRQQAVTFGADNDFISAPRLDDLQCVYGSMSGLLEAEPVDRVAVHAVFNNEEVGSETKQGAASTFLTDTIRRICMAFGRSEEYIMRLMTESFMVSADNAHAMHPNYPEKADPTNKVILNGGIVIKYNANQHYTTDAVSGGIMRFICKKAGVPVQEYVNPSDIPGGSTLGSIATTRLSMNTVDIGLPQLAMHSSFETAGAKDTGYFVSMAKTFFSSSISCVEDGKYSIS